MASEHRKRQMKLAEKLDWNDKQKERTERVGGGGLSSSSSVLLNSKEKTPDDPLGILPSLAGHMRTMARRMVHDQDDKASSSNKTSRSNRWKAPLRNSMRVLHFHQLAGENINFWTS